MKNEGHFGVIPTGANAKEGENEINFLKEFELDEIKFSVKLCEGKDLEKFMEENQSHLDFCVNKERAKRLKKKNKTNLEEPIKLGDEEFEWSTKTYGYDKYYYKLEDENRKIIKIDANGTITICKTIQSLKPGRKYIIDYFVEYLHGDDFDVGFGDDQIGPLCWLRGPGGYGITSKGIYLNSGNCSNSAIKITSNIKKISFIVDLLNYTSEIYLDNTKVYSNFSINLNLTYYPMAAIRQLNNSVKLDVTELN